MRTIEIISSRYIERNNFPTTNFKDSQFQLGIPSEFNKFGNITKIMGTLKCRESITHHFVNTVNSSKAFVKTLNKARVIITGFNVEEAKVLRLKKTLNFIHRIEKESNISPLTSIKDVITPWKLPYKVFMFEGSNKWYRSSHTMSLWHLILRSCSRDEGLASTTTKEEILKYINKWKAEVKTSGQLWEKEDQAHIKSTYNNWVNLMKNINEIFPKNVHWANRYKADKTFNKPSADCYYPSTHRDGIRNFITGNSPHKALKAFEKFKE